MSRPVVLLTGATGYIGGRLLRRLEVEGVSIRCLARDPKALSARVSKETDVVQGDVADPLSLKAAFAGVHTAYYLIHSMAIGKKFEEMDRIAAKNFAEAAKQAGVARIIYLGGLGESSKELSPHLRSRQEVGDILRASGCQTVEFRASIVIGSGSLSFEMIRALVERLPVMVTPRWVSVPAQPIAIDDLLEYLIQACRLSFEGNAIFEIGGADQVSYKALMQEYARQRGLKRLMIPVPVLSPWLSSLWLGLVTPLFARIGRSLIESIRHSTVVRDTRPLTAFSVQPSGVREAIQQALKNEDREFAETHWSDSAASVGRPNRWGGRRFGNRLVDSRSVEVSAASEKVFAPIRRIGGQSGWYYANFLWQIRGLLDLLMGGVGMRRGRRHPDQIEVGSVIDCWRVEDYRPNEYLRLAAEMKLPGRAWLEWDVRPSAKGLIITQTATFDPLGIGGLLYWYGVWPLHELVFAGMLRKISRKIA